MRNLVLIHLESLNKINYQMNSQLFPTLKRWEQRSLSFSKYYATATSTFMVLSDIAYGGILQNEPSDKLTSRLDKFCYASSFLDDLRDRGYQIGVFGYPANKKEIIAVNQKKFIGYSAKLEDTDLYEEYMSNLEKTMDGEHPFVVWACNFVSNVSYNSFAKMELAESGLARWKVGYEFIDRSTNELLCMLERKGLMEQTTILFYGDHGDDFYSHGKHWGLAHAIEPYDSLIHTPFWIYDSRFKSGEEIDQLLSSTDIRGLIKRLLELPEHELSISDLQLPEREFAFARSAYARQMVREGSFNKGYCLTDGRFLFMADNRGMGLYQIEMDATCHHNLLDYFMLDGDVLKLNERVYKRLRYHFKSVIDPDALSEIEQVFLKFRKHLLDEVFRLYQYAECEERFSEIQFANINYGGTESSDISVESIQMGAVAEIVNRLLNCKQIDWLAVFGQLGKEMEGLCPTVKCRNISRLEEGIEYDVLYLAFENYNEFGRAATWIKENRERVTMIAYVKNLVGDSEQIQKIQAIPCQCSTLPMLTGKVYLYGSFFEYCDDVTVPVDFKVCAIMHVHNKADILETAIRHLLSQEADIYLVDNGSDDGSYEIMEKCKEKYPDHVFVKYFSVVEKKDICTEQIAMETDYNWYIHFEADEMRVGPWINKNLRETLYYVDQLGFNLMEDIVFDYKLPKSSECQRRIWKKSNSLRLTNSEKPVITLENPMIFPLCFMTRHISSNEKDGELLEGENNLGYVSLFMGCGMQMDVDREEFSISTRYFTGKKVVLYGAGNYGRNCYQKLSGVSEIIAWVDKNYAYMPWIDCNKIVSPECIRNLEFDAVFITIMDSDIWQEIRDGLVEIGIPVNKIF